MTRARHRQAGGFRGPSAFITLLALVPVLAVACLGTSGAAFRSTTSTSSTFTAAASFPTYSSTVLANSPLLYHRMADASGATVMADASGNGRAGVYTSATSSTSYGNAAGAPIGDGDAAVTTSGDNTYITTETPISGQTTFSLELWFRTSSPSGGLLVGFGDQNLATSGLYDRQLYVDGGGRLTFALWGNWTFALLRSPASYIDDNWHHVVAATDTQTMSLYVDGALVDTGPALESDPAFGYWRVGGDNLDYNPDRPTADAITGVLDEVAVYPTMLSAAHVSAHFAARTGTAYRSAVLADSPYLYWRLNEAGVEQAADSSGNGRTGAYYLGPSHGSDATGALAAPEATNSSVRFDGLVSGAYNPYQQTDPNVFSLEIWFRTTTRFGGRLLGLGSVTTGTSSSYDRHLYLRDDGRLVFGVNALGAHTTVTSTSAYRDGAWHMATATLGSAGMRLYVDGQLVAANAGVTAGDAITGYWRLGFDNLAGWPDAPTSYHFAGRIDEVAVYDTQLTANQVSEHYGASR